MLGILKKPLVAVGAASMLIAGGGALALEMASSAHATDSVVTYYTATNTVSVSATSWSDAIVSCNSGDSAVGGGYALNNWPTSQVRNDHEVTTGSNVNPTEWYVEVYNGDSISRSATVHVVCEHQ